MKQPGSSVNLTVSGLYNNRNQITDLNISGAKMPSTQLVKYDYWKNGVVAKRQVAGAFAANMQYENDKVSQIQYDKGAQSLNQFKYEYDLNDNVMSRNENNYVTNFSYTPLDQVKTSSEFNERYTYDGRYNRLTLESSRELPIQEAQYEYNQKNQLTKAIGAKGTASYSYNGDGLMVERTVSNARHRYYYNEDKRIVAEAVIEADGKPRILYVYIYDTNGAIIGRQDA
ncbi:hypothetical protein MH117_26365, partial [Paenibacillus sp. ACRRX]|nr:hypothetical protein [Paenibacillus sp. ACRRX]